MTNNNRPAQPLSISCRAADLSEVLRDSIDQIANRQRIARTVNGHWMRYLYGLTEAPQWTALTDSELEAAKGTQAAARRLMGVAPEPVDADERAGWPVGMAPVLRVVK